MRHHHLIKNINISLFSVLVMSFDAVVGFYQVFKELIKIFNKNFRETSNFLAMDHNKQNEAKTKRKQPTIGFSP